MSATDNSPDIRRGKRISRRAARRDDSSMPAIFFCIRGVTVAEKSRNTSILGRTTSRNFNRSLGKSVCPVLPEAMEANSGSRDRHHWPRYAISSLSLGRTIVTCESAVTLSRPNKYWATRPKVPSPVELIRISPKRSHLPLITLGLCRLAIVRSTL